MHRDLPNDHEAEQAVLGSLLIDRDAIAAVVDRLPYEAFAQPRHQLIYRAMRKLWDERIPCDLVTLADFLTRYERLETVGGVPYLSDLMRSTPTAAHVGWYADTVLRCARQRAVIDAATGIVAASYRDDPDVDLAVQTIRSAVEPFSSEGQPSTFSELVSDTGEQFVERWEGRLQETVVSTGSHALDKMLHGGVRGGEVLVLAARPSMGKTAFALRIAQASPSLYFSLEMTTQQLVTRLAVSTAGVDYGVAVTRIGDQRARDKLLFATEQLQRTSKIVAIHDRIRTTGGIESALERAMADHGATTAIIDHIGILDDNHPKASEYERVSRISWALKRMALRTGAAVIVLCQLNRQVEQRPGCVPYMADLRESGRIEENADAVALLYRRNYYVGRGMVEPDPVLDWVDEHERAQLSIAKNRNGMPGTVDLGWDGRTMTFHDVWKAA